ncbi:Myb-related protein 2-like protein [Tanacetum coccineum]
MSSCRNVEGKNSWDELVGTPGQAASDIIERQNERVYAVIVPEGSFVTTDIQCDRVRVFVNKNNIVTRDANSATKMLLRLAALLQCIKKELVPTILDKCKRDFFAKMVVDVVIATERFDTLGIKKKYRLSKNLYRQTNSCGSRKIDMVAPSGDTIGETSEIHMSNSSISPQTNKNLQISEELQMQIEVQRRLHEQLEVQRHLQVHIEAQGKYLKSVLEKAQETLGRQNLGTVGLEAAKLRLSELVSKVSTQCLNSAFAGIKDVSTQTNQPTDYSIKPENVEMAYFGQKLDLNARAGNDAASSRKHFDLNGLSW